MKKVLYLVIACALFNISNAQENNGSISENKSILDKEATFIVDKTEHNFGKISESKGDVECEFIITNTGDSSLVISKVTASCGCTVPNWSKEPIAPGKQGFIAVKFSPKGRSGNFSKILAIYTNSTPKRMSLKIKGSIE